MTQILLFLALAFGMSFAHSKVEIVLACECQISDSSGSHELVSVLGEINAETAEDVFRCERGTPENYRRSCFKAYMNAEHNCSTLGRDRSLSARIISNSCAVQITDSEE